MNKVNIKCPRCHTNKSYKFGLNKQTNQCRQCKHQFALGDGNGLPKLNYPKCPMCGKGTYLHHPYKYYNRYKCNNIIVKHHTTNIDENSSENIASSLSMKEMCFPLHIILTTLTPYFLDNSSTRSIVHFLMMNSGI